MDFDVIVVGTRVAGATTAMLLARAGLRVLAVDRARFPSDTLSTHQVQLPGGALLHRWGLLDQLITRGTPPARHVVFDTGSAVLRGSYAPADGVDAVYSPRRTALDALLVAAAREAGATVEEGFTVDALLRDGHRVTGIRGRFKTANRLLAGAAQPAFAQSAVPAQAAASAQSAVPAQAAASAQSAVPAQAAASAQSAARAQAAVAHSAGPVGVPDQRGRGGEISVTAALVIGADGKHSTVAKEVGARVYRRRPSASGVLYGYFAGLPVGGGEVYVRPDRMLTLWPTDDELTLVYLGIPASRFLEAKAAGLQNSAEGIADLGDRMSAARPAEHVRGTTDVPGLIRKPYGPGWALVGDAGLVMDPITGQGIGNALRDAESLSRAIVDGLGGTRTPAGALRDHHRRRDADRRPMYDLTARLATFRPDPAADILFPVLAENPAHVTRFLGMLTGTRPVSDVFGPAALRRTVGARGMARMLGARALRAARR